MNVPAISVILPAYNAEAFIRNAIQSVLDQSFREFELIIINDGSTDKTEAIIQSFSEPRIVYVLNESNNGLIATLNKGVTIARGKYIARMDADDICLPGRFEKQKKILDNDETIAVLATTVNFINIKGDKTGEWILDRQTILPEQIRNKMPAENCISHPSVMMKADVIKKLQYKNNQKNIEDYDLWLRVLNRGLKIAKLNEPLLLYRLHDESVTSIHLKNRNPFLNHWKMKMRFLVAEIFSGHLNWFTCRVIIYAKLDLIIGIGKSIKNLFR